MNKNNIAITLGIVCIVLTIAIYVQIKTVNNSNSAVMQGFAEDSLRDEVLKWIEKTDNLTKQVEAQEKKLDETRERATENDTSSSKIEEQINLNNNLLGTTNLVGQGIEMVIEDDPTATKNNISLLDDISYHIVHDADLRVIVNELKNAGAEAISINGQRIVNTTAITCVRKCYKGK